MNHQICRLVQDCSNSSALAMELPQILSPLDHDWSATQENHENVPPSYITG